MSITRQTSMYTTSALFVLFVAATAIHAADGGGEISFYQYEVTTMISTLLQ